MNIQTPLIINSNNKNDGLPRWLCILQTTTCTKYALYMKLKETCSIKYNNNKIETGKKEDPIIIFVLGKASRQEQQATEQQ